jgi:cyanate permease
LMGAMFLFGMISPFIAMITLKVTGMWFSRKQLGLASGVLSMGMAFGFLIGSLFSATLLTPLLGGWRNVLFFYGVLAMVISIPWMFTRTAPGTAPVEHANTISPSSLRQNMVYVARFRKVWLYGFALLGINGCVQGAMGYLPLYLRNLGWTTTAADGATAAFYTASLICVVPIALWSDRMGSRRRVIIIAGSMIAAGIGLLSISQGALVWVAVCLAGLAGDGFMAVLLASVIEIDGVGTAYAGTALGMVMVFSRMGALVAPSLGNSLAEINAGLPFLFWSALGFMGLIGLGKKFKD